MKVVKKNKKPKIIVVLGATASGKTGLGIKLAQDFNGEIISADSRQVYKGMDIGTGKDLQDYQIKSGKKKIIIPYHLIDVVSPQQEFNLAKYKKMAEKAIADILKRKRLPIIVGGTGLYLQALIDNYDLSKRAPDLAFRKELEALTVLELWNRLKKENELFANNLNSSDRHNKRHLIRYLELAKESQELIVRTKKPSQFDALLLGLDWPKEILWERIKKRLLDRLEKENMVLEIKRLHRSGVSWERLESFGLEYRFIARYLQKQISYEEMIEQLFFAIRQFAKRQKTWFRRWEKQGRKINWVKNLNEANELVNDFLNKN
ncbi:MAG: tRNA (adenosine(37)-N6)-dimethylallyltransferase MiaA [Planctomycetes bacterium]|jgi:tRNA dimethylallyltransferase|nr:tRNA (adenosine(37)-N6)-dimethylallyltransferase MiaA [Planctomycetota bacterium]